MNRKLKVTATTIIIAAVVSAAVVLITHDTNTVPARHGIAQEITRTPLAGGDPFSDQYVRELRKFYGKTISEKSTQAALIGLRDFFMATQPEKGRTLFYALLKRAFPDQADDILKTLDKLDLYERWLEDNREILARMSAEERKAALWKKRMELFGDDAEKIWSGEMLATESRKAKIQDTLAVLNELNDTSLDQKLQVYQGVLREAYEGTPENYILDQKGLLSKVFFSIDSVQDELKKMSPRERQEEINRIRREMGLTEQQIESMARRDADNELRWETGLQYMKDREAAEQQLEGPELEARLKELREQYFDDEANTIELEEKDGFFRFRRPHIFGRN
ncbi:MAG TPA: hypothetical protein PLV84_07025 [Deltaproteobacteria bacterium]|nr:hypothetical protein [Deltaproteobacteria bacterium]